MKKLYYIIVLLVLSNSITAQIVYKPAYFIDNSGVKIECLIRDFDWKSNPVSIEYKVSEDGQIQIAKIDNIQEFRIENYAKYIRKTVQIDRWDVFSPITENRESEYKTETLLLKEILNGAATLYGYADGSLATYFYVVNDNSIRQLIRKNYITVDAIGNKREFVNYMYKRQLYGDLKCSDITENQAKNLNYYEADFVKFFQRYNTCMGETSDLVAPSKIKLNLSIRPGIVQNSFDLKYNTDQRYTYDFGSKTQFRIGVEAEIIMPFNKDKWSLLLEPVYTAFKAEGDGTIDTDNIDYKAIEFQFVARHYMYLNSESRIFVNAGVNFALNINNVDYSPKRQDLILQLKPSPQIILGAGYKYKKASAEIRYLGNQNLLANQSVWDSKFTSLAFVLGYQIF